MARPKAARTRAASTSTYTAPSGAARLGRSFAATAAAAAHAPRWCHIWTGAAWRRWSAPEACTGMHGRCWWWTATSSPPRCSSWQRASQSPSPAKTLVGRAGTWTRRRWTPCWWTWDSCCLTSTALAPPQLPCRSTRCASRRAVCWRWPATWAGARSRSASCRWPCARTAAPAALWTRSTRRRRAAGCRCCTARRARAACRCCTACCTGELHTATRGEQTARAPAASRRCTWRRCTTTCASPFCCSTTARPARTRACWRPTASRRSTLRSRWATTTSRLCCMRCAAVCAAAASPRAVTPSCRASSPRRSRTAWAACRRTSASTATRRCPR
mmetsp:Transcript_16692/g.49945  ORF Transcript_16692/g.49945 Transcript_16692/m.49945 type:complete len:330 (-) Transcript_16692:1260-2249(-)